MIRQNEIFVQVLDENGEAAASKTPVPPTLRRRGRSHRPDA
jgi:hypothetical protein